MRTFNKVTRFFFAVSFAACPAFGAVAAPSRPLIATCAFETPAFKTDAAGVTRVTVPGCAQWVRLGLPVVPFQTLRLLLPPGCTATCCVVRASSAKVTLPGAWQLEIGRDPVAFSASAAPSSAPSAQSVPTPYPAALAELASVQRLSGFDIAFIRVFPLQYNRALQQLDYSAEVTVEVLLSAAADSLIRPSSRADEQRRVKAAVDNPEALSAFSPIRSSAVDDPSTNYLLVTRSTLLPSFQPLIAQKQMAGLTVRTEVMETITNQYAGADAAESLRTFIRHANTSWGVQYVLLGGDTKVVPYRGVYARCSGTVWNLMPSDLYFACLDGSWNRDGDSIWGEPTDGESGGDVDLLPEVCVGRAPVETPEEVTNFVARCLAAAQAPSVRFHALLAGEYLGTSDAQGGAALDALLPSFDGSLCPVSWLDDRPQTAAAWSAADALDALNRSPLLVAHFGHGTADGFGTTALRLTAPDLSGLTHAAPFLLYSTACYTGAFDNNFGMGDCIAEELVKLTACGAFAVVANSREGWYDSASEGRYSGEFQKAFFARLLADERVPAGVANQLAKQDLLGSVETAGSNMPYRWCLFGINLFGDPHASVRVPLSLLFRATPAERVVTWNSWATHSYRVFRSTDLAAGAGVCIASNAVATPPLNVYTDAAPEPVRAFYRVLAEPK